MPLPVELKGIREVGGPEVVALDELGPVTLAETGDRRTVVTDETAGMFAAVTGDVLTTSDCDTFELGHDLVVVTAGAVTRKFPVPGIGEQAIGLKHVEEAVAIRDRLLTAFDRAATLPAGPLRTRLLTVTVVGGGFSGVEGFGELLSLATALLKRYPEITRDEPRFHLVEATGRILPEVTDRPGRWVVRSQAHRPPGRRARLPRGPGRPAGRHRDRAGARRVGGG